MNARTEYSLLPGPAGALECALDGPPESAGLALLCHPHPLHGGTMENKVVQTLARAFVQLGWRAVRFNYRGVGRSEGIWDEGRGEVEDAMCVLRALRTPGQALALGGFSFGSYVASQVAARVASEAPASSIVLVGPAVETFPMAPVPPEALVIHGEHDDVVSLSGVLDWARPQGLPVTVVPGAGHFFHGQMGLLKSLVVRACRAPAVPAP
jgi:alpha/beta superfamily hydrolase